MSLVRNLVERALKTQHGFKDLELSANEVFETHSRADAKAIALELLASEARQGRCVGTFILGRLAAADSDALLILKERVSGDTDWRVQEILAKAFDQFCADTGYEAALPVVRDWLASPSPNVRRAVTEGLRIWTDRGYFIDHPEVAVALMTPFRADPSEYLRKSVGNALRDISKTHPDLIRQEVAGWSLDERAEKQTYKLATRIIFPPE